MMFLARSRTWITLAVLAAAMPMAVTADDRQPPEQIDALQKELALLKKERERVQQSLRDLATNLENAKNEARTDESLIAAGNRFLQPLTELEEARRRYYENQPSGWHPLDRALANIDDYFDFQNNYPRRRQRIIDELNDRLLRDGLPVEGEDSPRYYQDVESVQRNVHQWGMHVQNVLRPGIRLMTLHQTQLTEYAARLADEKARLVERIAVARGRQEDAAEAAQSPEAAQPPDPQPPATPPATDARPEVITRIVGVESSEPSGLAPSRRIVWRFYVEFEETAGAAATVRVTRVTVGPSEQMRSPWDRFPGPRQVAYIEPGYDIALRRPDVTLEMHPGMAAAMEPEGAQEAPPVQREGPFYLTVSEDAGFAGTYEIAYDVLLPGGERVTSSAVTFSPAGASARREEPVCQLVVDRPEAGALTERNLDGEGLACVVKIPVLPSNLPPGLYHIKAEVAAGRTFYLWGDVRPDTTSAEFRASIPVKQGTFTITFTPVDIPRVAPQQVTCTFTVTERDTEAIDKNRQAISNTENALRTGASGGYFGDSSDRADAATQRRHQSNLGDHHASLAKKLSRHCQHHEDARRAAERAIEYLRASSLEAGHPYWTGAYEALFNACYGVADAAALDAPARALIDCHRLDAERKQSDGTWVSKYALGAAAHVHLQLAERLLVLGATNCEARALELYHAAADLAAENLRRVGQGSNVSPQSLRSDVHSRYRVLDTVLKYHGE
ncbi:MAG: hypothetical protein PVJ57_12090 [Phycisphaerae bacterium]|jgi:septal ring factor EnvC (AmiA/AmiB activator)